MDQAYTVLGARKGDTREVLVSAYRQSLRDQAALMSTDAVASLAEIQRINAAYSLVTGAGVGTEEYLAGIISGQTAPDGTAIAEAPMSATSLRAEGIRSGRGQPARRASESGGSLRGTPDDAEPAAPDESAPRLRGEAGLPSVEISADLEQRLDRAHQRLLRDITSESARAGIHRVSGIDLAHGTIRVRCDTPKKPGKNTIVLPVLAREGSSISATGKLKAISVTSPDTKQVEVRVGNIDSLVEQHGDTRLTLVFDGISE